MKLENTNPKCPECNSRTRKAGLNVSRSGKSQRYQCYECGLNFSTKLGDPQ